MSTTISTIESASLPEATRRESTFLGHPVGLYVLFFTETWERFSYYGMRALLVLYMTEHLIKSTQQGSVVYGFSTLHSLLEWSFGPLAIQPLASQIYGIYTSFIYLTPLFGGMLADQILGHRKTVVIGGILMAIGHFLMAFESLFLLALFVLILGNGCFKPNIATQVGALYPKNDPRRDQAFSIFYLGVNLGAFFSPLICGTLGQTYGWHYGFAAAGIGMMIGVVIYLLGQDYLAPEQAPRKRNLKQDRKPLTSYEWHAIFGLIILCLLNSVFWAVYEEQGNTLQIFADKNTDWHIWGWQMPSTWFQSINPAFIFILTPLLNIFWTYQTKKKSEPSSIIKMSIGCFLLGGSFFCLMLAITGMGETDRISFLWLAGCTLIYTLGELYLSPIGLSLVTKVAPARLVGMMMGVWFLSNSLGNYLSGYLGTFYEAMSKQGFFLLLSVLACSAGIAIFSLQGFLKKAIQQQG